jgi:hypothetical protein
MKTCTIFLCGMFTALSIIGLVVKELDMLSLAVIPMAVTFIVACIMDENDKDRKQG